MDINRYEVTKNGMEIPIEIQGLENIAGGINPGELKKRDSVLLITKEENMARVAIDVSNEQAVAFAWDPQTHTYTYEFYVLGVVERTSYIRPGTEILLIVVDWGTEDISPRVRIAPFDFFINEGWDLMGTVVNKFLS